MHLTVSSHSLWINLPASLLLVAGLTWGLGRLDLQAAAAAAAAALPPPRYADDGSHGPAAFLEALQQRGRRRGLPPGPAAAERDAWRSQVGSPVVAFAWEKLCNSIVQQVRVGIQGPGSRVQQVRVGIQQVWVGIH